MSIKKLAIVVSHPIQYYAPLFAHLSKSIQLKVFYAFQPDSKQQGKEGFGKEFSWDIDLLKGYEYSFLENIASDPSSAHFAGCDTPRIGDELKQYEATHVVCIGWHLKMYRQALAYCEQSNIPIAVRGDSQLNPLQSWHKRLIKKLYYPFYLKRFDAFLSVGKRNRKYLKEYGVKDEQIIFSPHAVDQEFWKVKRKERDTSYVFIWVAKFISKKRPHEAINAFKLFLAKHPELSSKIELWMVGSGELYDSSIDLAKDFKQVKFLGFKNQQELREVYSKTDCLLLTSDYGETWGLVVNEAFASGLPAIVSNAAGCSEDLITESTGRVYQMGNVEDLYEAMRGLYLEEQKIEWTENKRNAIQEKNKAYSFSENLPAFERFLQSF